MRLLKNIFCSSSLLNSKASFIPSFMNNIKSTNISTKTTMFLSRFNYRNTKNTISEINKDIFSFVKEEKAFDNKRYSILNFPDFFNHTYINEYDLTFVTNFDNKNNFKSKIKKKQLLFIPGLDMTAIGFYPTSLMLKEDYDIHTLVTGLNTTVKFNEIATSVEKYINKNINKEIVIIGESFGAIVAIYITNKIQRYKNVKLVLINPATSYNKSNWPDRIVKFSPNDNSVDKKINSNVFFDAISNGPSMFNIFKTVEFLKKNFPENSKYHTYVYFYMAINLLNIPHESIHFRLNYWIVDGLKMIGDNYSNIKCKTLLIAGEDDDFLPSKEEIHFLHSKIKNSIPIIVKNSAHSIPINNCDISKLIKKYLD
jgi:pimeloyl-ACP methyl ester carboxylesterase